MTIRTVDDRTAVSLECGETALVRQKATVGPVTAGAFGAVGLAEDATRSGLILKNVRDLKEDACMERLAVVHPFKERSRLTRSKALAVLLHKGRTKGAGPCAIQLTGSLESVLLEPRECILATETGLYIVSKSWVKRNRRRSCPRISTAR